MLSWGALPRASMPGYHSAPPSLPIVTAGCCGQVAGGSSSAGDSCSSLGGAHLPPQQRRGGEHGVAVHSRYAHVHQHEDQSSSLPQSQQCLYQTTVPVNGGGCLPLAAAWVCVLQLYSSCVAS